MPEVLSVEATLARLARISNDDSDRPAARAPWTVDVDGVVWSGASEGHVLVALTVDVGAARLPVSAFQAADARPNVLLELLAPWPATGRVDAERLRQWIGGVLDADDCSICRGTDRTRCPECLGARAIHCECERCGHTHDYECDACGDDGTVRCAHGRRFLDYGVIEGADVPRVVIDRTLLARAAAFLAGPIDVGITSPDAMVRFRGDGWRVAVMPCRDFANRADRAPRLTLDHGAA